MDIGTLNEKPLHAGLKTWYAKPGDTFEIKVDNYFIDIIQDDLLVEIQTRQLFSHQAQGSGYNQTPLTPVGLSHCARKVDCKATQK